MESISVNKSMLLSLHIYHNSRRLIPDLNHCPCICTLLIAKVVLPATTRVKREFLILRFVSLVLPCFVMYLLRTSVVCVSITSGLMWELKLSELLFLYWVRYSFYERQTATSTPARPPGGALYKDAFKSMTGVTGITGITCINGITSLLIRSCSQLISWL